MIIFFIRKKMIAAVILTAVLVGVYVRSRNVVACVLAHGVINVVTLVVVPAVL